MDNQLPKETDFRKIFLAKTPLLDVRAPIEYLAGAFPHSQNIPLLNDEERHLVGIRYKQQGQEAAIALGYQLVDAEQKHHRITQWQNFFKENPNGMLYCFRGGLRSRLTQAMLASEAGIAVPRLVGGYKAMRRFLIDTLTIEGARSRFIVLGGRTGSGKTHFLQQYSRMLDLEGIAHHKGSAFGQELDPQPNQVNIDHQIAIELLRLNAVETITPILIEDEGAKIGARRVPISVWQAMQNAPLIILEIPIEQRVEHIFNDYILLKKQQIKQRHPDETTAFTQHRDAVQKSLAQIQRRLGAERHQQFQTLALEGMGEFYKNGDPSKLNVLIKRMLVEYYDPMYDYQNKNKTTRIAFSGNQTSVQEWLQEKKV